MQEEIKEPEKKDSIKEFIEKAAPYLKILIVNWKKLLIINGIVAVVSAAFLLLFVKNYYDSTITIMPDYGVNASLGGLSSLAAMAGFSVGQTAPNEIYNNLIYSESVLKPVIYAKYKTEEFEKPVNLIEYFEIEPNTVSEEAPKELQERDKFIQMMESFSKNILTSSVDRITTILSVSVRTNEPAMSSEIANNIVKSLDHYVRTKRKSNAKEQRIYIEERVKQVKDSLTIVENKLKAFREQNRIVGQSPQLLLEQGRLQRELEIQQTIFIELTKQMELIKLEEIKDAPIINIREEAGIPIVKAGPSRLKLLVIVLLLTFIFITGYILFLKDIIRNYRKAIFLYLKKME